MPAGATKANGARRLKEGLGCSSMVCFGDGLNDLPLLQAADHACAVANAVPELRAAADEVIPSNAQDGVAKWLLADTAPALALGERAGAFRLRLYRPEDLEELMLCAVNGRFGGDYPLRPPNPPRGQGVYTLEGFLPPESEERYRAQMAAETRPVIGVLIHDHYAKTGNL